MRDLSENALRTIEAALLSGPQQCRYHGADFGRLGMQFGEPRCESCQHPWRITQALAEVRRVREDAFEGNPPETGEQPQVAVITREDLTGHIEDPDVLCICNQCTGFKPCQNGCGHGPCICTDEASVARCRRFRESSKARIRDWEASRA